MVAGEVPGACATDVGGRVVATSGGTVVAAPTGTVVVGAVVVVPLTGEKTVVVVVVVVGGSVVVVVVGGSVVVVVVVVVGASAKSTCTVMSDEAVTVHVLPEHPLTFHEETTQPLSGVAVKVMLVPSSTVDVEVPAEARERALTLDVTFPLPTCVNDTWRDTRGEAVTLPAAVAVAEPASTVQ